MTDVSRLDAQPSIPPSPLDRQAACGLALSTLQNPGTRRCARALAQHVLAYDAELARVTERAEQAESDLHVYTKRWAKNLDDAVEIARKTEERAAELQARLAEIAADGCQAIHSGRSREWTCLDQEAWMRSPENAHLTPNEYGNATLRGEHRCYACRAAAALAASVSGDSETSGDESEHDL